MQSSTEAIAVLKASEKPAYAAEDISDIDVSMTFDLLHRKDTERDQILSKLLKVRNEIQSRVPLPYQAENVFGERVWSSLLPGYARLLNLVVEKAKQTLHTGGLLGLLLADEKDFVATVRVAMFTANKGLVHISVLYGTT